MKYVVAQVSGLEKPNTWRWRMAPDELPDEEAPRQRGTGGVSPLLPCIVTVVPREARRRALAGCQVPEVHGYACVDTGTLSSAIDIAVMTELGIVPTEYIKVWGCSSREPMWGPVFPATLMFPGSNLDDLVLSDFLGMTLERDGNCEVDGKPVIALLGLRALSRYTMIYEGPEGRITLIRR